MTYNQEKFIRNAINAIFEQSYTKPFELIIANDGSSDKSHSIITDTLQNKPSHIDVNYVLHKKNKGSLENFNLALKLVNGSYVVVADGDDISLPHRLESVYEKHNILNKDLYISNAVVGEGKKYYEPFDLSNISLDDIYSPKIPVFGASYVFNISLIKKYGLIDSVYVSGNNMDQNIFWRAWMENGCHYIDEPLIVYNLHNNNSSISHKVELYKKEGNYINAKLFSVKNHLNRLGNLYYLLAINKKSSYNKKLLHASKTHFERLCECIDSFGEMITSTELENNIYYVNTNTISCNGYKYRISYKGLMKLYRTDFIRVIYFLLFDKSIDSVLFDKLEGFLAKKKITKRVLVLILLKQSRKVLSNPLLDRISLFFYYVVLFKKTSKIHYEIFKECKT